MGQGFYVSRLAEPPDYQRIISSTCRAGGRPWPRFVWQSDMQPVCITTRTQHKGGKNSSFRRIGELETLRWRKRGQLMDFAMGVMHRKLAPPV